METQELPPAVGRRVYFLSGFDPRGAAFYYRYFADQLKAYQRRSGRSLRLSRRRSHIESLVSRWQVIEGGGAESSVLLDYCFLHWDDIARMNWPRQPLVLVWDGLFVYAWYLLGGGIQRIARLSHQVALCGLYPFLLALCCLGVAALAGVTLPPLLAQHGVQTQLAGALGLGVAVLLLGVCWPLADRLGAVWLFRSIRFTHILGQERDRELRPRLEVLAERILELESQDPAQEILLVGHSSGSFVMAMLAATLRRQHGFMAVAPRVKLLTLGQNLANLAVHRSACSFHTDLQELAREPRLPWRDITSQDDYLCFAGVDPYRSCGLRIAQPAYPEQQLIPLAQRLELTGLVGLLTHQFSLHFEYIATGLAEDHVGFDYLAHLLEPLDMASKPACEPLR
ncbi:MAG: hypothetical protein WCK64_06090 [Synechococcaceae cyanobacterium ELA445]